MLVVGHALFRPSISAAVGKLYAQADPQRDDAYSLFDVVFNIGAACGPVAGGFLRQHFGWSVAFSAGALAMGSARTLGMLCCGWLIAQEIESTRAPRYAAVRVQPLAVAGMIGLLGTTLLFTAAYE